MEPEIIGYSGSDHSVPIINAPHKDDPNRLMTGQFGPGNQGRHGRHKGSLNRVTLGMKSELARHMDEIGPKANPLLVLASIYEDDKNPAIVRARAAEMLLRYLAPRLLQVEVDQPDVEVETQIVRLKSTLRTILGKD